VLNPKVAGASQTGKSVTCDNYTVSTLVHAAGDYISFGTDPKMYKVDEDVTSTSTGTATVKITPPLIKSPQDNASVNYAAPIFNVVQGNSTQEYSVAPPMLFTYEVDVEEVY